MEGPVAARFKCINGFTKQKMIDTINEKMLDHGSWNPGVHPDGVSGPGFCAYRSPNGNKCAVGVFIPDDLYVPEMEGRGVRHISFTDFYPGIEKCMPLELDGLYEMQQRHDVSATQTPTLDPRPALIEWINANVED